MPKRKTVSQLQKLCLENVANNMDRAWVKDYRQNHLAGSLVLKLFYIVAKTEQRTSAMLHSLFLPQLKELYLSKCPELVNEVTAQIITMRCKNLSTLDLKKCDLIPAEALVNLMKGLPHLVALDLSETQCNTQVLSAVGSSCQHLQKLDILNCKRLLPDSLLYLAYDPVASSFCCPALQQLRVHGLQPIPKSQSLTWALAFLLLALPRLRILIHDLLPEAMCLIHNQHLDSAQMPSGFPSLVQLAQGRPFLHGNEEQSRYILGLKEVFNVSESFLPVASAMCPYLEEATVFQECNGSFLQSLLSFRYLTHLSVFSINGRDLADLFAVTAYLGPQLQSLWCKDFGYSDALSFHTLLSHCPNLQEFAAFLHPQVPPYRPNIALDHGTSPTSLKFPLLCYFTLDLFEKENPLSCQHATQVKNCLISVFQHSPMLEIMSLYRLPFSLDNLFEKVLEPPSHALANLISLSLTENEVSIHTIHLLLSADNELSFLELHRCPDINKRAYEELRQRISRQGLEVRINWEETPSPTENDLPF
ncbi:uncharacterized protein LOC121923954 [Sceloporus undulatus]|uniref:uncharacterized protein LOC121923954 n=1 Tax=Sceloporus undulatus TaxID=8520 RepID=UPI001C4C1D04|nr:uncharacterized protein LOC121923954 [Sceloporus undulatus]